jgi:hypothetical protein
MQFRAVVPDVLGSRSRRHRALAEPQAEAPRAKNPALQRADGTKRKGSPRLQPPNSNVAGSHFECDLAKTKERDIRRFGGLVLQPRARQLYDQAAPK